MFRETAAASRNSPDLDLSFSQPSPTKLSPCSLFCKKNTHLQSTLSEFPFPFLTSSQSVKLLPFVSASAFRFARTPNSIDLMQHRRWLAA